MINALKIWVGKPERKRPNERYSCRREDNIRMDLWGKNCGKCGLNTCGTG